MGEQQQFQKYLTFLLYGFYSFIPDNIAFILKPEWSRKGENQSGLGTFHLFLAVSLTGPLMQLLNIIILTTDDICHHAVMF